MAYWRAYAAARDVCDTDLREALIDALDRIEDLQEELAHATDEAERRADEAIDEADVLRAQAEERLEEYMRAEGNDKVHADLQKLREELDEERDKRTAAEARARDAEDRLSNERLIVENYSDMLALARKITSAVEGTRLPKQHVRSVRPANDARKRVKR